MQYKQTRDELKQQFEEQIGFLQQSCKLYDQGRVAEAKRLSVTLRILLNDEGRGTSLFKQLEMKQLNFYNSAKSLPPSTTAFQQSEALLIGSDIVAGVFVPLYSHAKDLASLVDFNTWWNMPVLLTADRSEALSRKEIIISMANKDGGAHVDRQLDSKYARFSRLSGMGHLTAQNVPLGPNGELPQSLAGVHFERVPLAEYATVRQIAHEVLETLNRQIETPMILNPIISSLYLR